MAHGAGRRWARSDVLVGVGLPWNNHVSVFLVLQAAAVEPPPEPPPPSDFEAHVIALLTRIAAGVERLSAHLGA